MMLESPYIEITNKCNLNCRHCYNSSGTNKYVREISFDSLTRLFEEFSAFNVKSITLSGGEPLLHSEFNRILELITNHKNIKFVIITNATIMNKHLIRLCKTLENIHIQISLDGADEDSNAPIRGRGSFQLSLNTIKALAEGINKPNVKMVISKLNKDTIDDFTSLAVGLGAAPSFSFVEKMGNSLDSWDNIALDDGEKIEVLKTIMALKEKYHLDCELPLSTTGCPLVDESIPLRVLIKPDGSIHPCQQLYNERFCIGSIYDLNYEYINHRMNLIRDLAQKRKETIFNCHRCINRSKCGKGCMAEAFNLFGDCLALDGNCKMRIFQTIRLGINYMEAVKPIEESGHV